MPDASRLQQPGLRPAAIEIVVDGQVISAHPGETVATAMLAAHMPVCRTHQPGLQHAPVCNMGVCFECAVIIDGHGPKRGCMTRVRPGMVVEVRRDA